MSWYQCGRTIVISLIRACFMVDHFSHWSKAIPEENTSNESFCLGVLSVKIIRVNRIAKLSESILHFVIGGAIGGVAIIEGG